MGRREPRVRDTHERVLAAALAEFAERGYQGASIEDIAARAELTKGAVYYYFSDKDDLAADLQAELWDRLGREANARLDPAGSTAEHLKAAFRAFLTSLQDQAEARFFLRDCWAVPALEASGRRTHERGVALVRSVLDAGMARGELAVLDPDAAARVLLGAFAEATLHILTTGDLDATVEVVDRVIEALAAPGPVPVGHDRGEHAELSGAT